MTAKSTRTATLLIMALFLCQPMAFGAWLAMIPYIKETLDLTKGQLAIALLGMPLALIPTMQIASGVVAKLGPRKTFAFVLPLQTLAVGLPFLAGSLPTLFLALAVFGALVAFMEVALNTYAGRLEKAAGLIVMSRCHGFWALGVMTGSLLATLMFGLGAAVAVLLISATSAGLGIWAGLSLPKLAGEDEAAAAPRRKLRDAPRVLFLISLFVFMVTLVEGGMADWAAVYLTELWGGAAQDAGIAVTVFAGFLAAGRFVGDFLKRRLGARGAARLTVALAGLGLICVTVSTMTPLIFIGIALAGLGVSIGFPLGISAAAGLDDTYESQNIATMSMIAMSSFLLGPPFIGLLADAFSLRAAFVGLIPGLCLAFWLTKHFPKA